MSHRPDRRTGSKPEATSPRPRRSPWRLPTLGVIWLSLSASPEPSRGQLTAPPASDFEITTLAKGVAKTGEPIAMAVLPDRSVLHTSRDGQVWLTTADASTSRAGKIPVYSHDEDGLQGIAIDSGFKDNRWVYVYYAPPLATPGGDAPTTATGPADFAPFRGHNQLSRIKLTKGGQLDLATEQKILQVPADRGICCHAGGEIDFDVAGNLYLSTGDDTNPFKSDDFTPIDERPTRNPAFDAQRTSANTNDLRGKLIRIKVEDDGTYSIPAGNMFPPGTAKTLPEIYAMGFRNPFRFAVDPKTGWVFLGDYGPDAVAADPNRGPGGQVEFNLIKGPGNYGWPYVTGKNDPFVDFDFATGQSGAKFSAAAPKNESPHNTGLVDLPPAIPAWIAYDGTSVPEFGGGSESPMGGETYRFDPDNISDTKFPEYYDGKNFAYDFGRGWFRVLNVGADGTLLGIDKFLDSSGIKQPINAEFGPDGSLYVLDYGTGFMRGDANSALYRIDYTRGNRRPVANLEADHPAGTTPLVVKFSSAGSADPEGTPITLAWDLDGNGTIDSTEASPTFTYNAVGRFTATLTVTDGTGLKRSTSVNIVAGNAPPTVTITSPVRGGIFSFGESLAYQVTVTDPEDGAIDCARVRVDTALGHDKHAHGEKNFDGCSGTLTIPGLWEPKSEHSFFVLTASYTDKGVSTPGLELEGTAQIVLEHRVQQAEFADARKGTQDVPHDGAEGGRRVGFIQAGDWLRFDDMNLAGIDGVTARVSSGTTSGIEFRADSPTGTLLATIAVPDTHGFDNYVILPPVSLRDPGGTRPLFVVFTGPNMDLDEFTFVGRGVTSPAATPGTGRSPAHNHAGGAPHPH